jgi:hypothetical protein
MTTKAPTNRRSRRRDQAVHDWVKSGGALLADCRSRAVWWRCFCTREPFRRRYEQGLHVRSGELVPSSPSQLIFSRENKLLASHPITEGRNENERINLLRSFTGQSLKGPEGSVVILNLQHATDRRLTRRNFSLRSGTRASYRVQIRQRSRVVQGEAAMLSAQISGADKTSDGNERARQRQQAIRAQPDALAIGNIEVSVG